MSALRSFLIKHGFDVKTFFCTSVKTLAPKRKTLTSDKKSYSKTVLKLTFHINICAFSIKSTEVACFTNVTSMFLYGDICDIPSFPFLYFTAVYVCPSDIWRGPSHNTFKSQISALYNRMMLIHVCYCHWSCQMRTVTDVSKLLDNGTSCC